MCSRTTVICQASLPGPKAVSALGFGWTLNGLMLRPVLVQLDHLSDGVQAVSCSQPVTVIWFLLQSLITFLSIWS